MYFTHALARLPALTCGQGQTTASLGTPDIQQTRQQFMLYVEVLLQLGLSVTVLPAQDNYPDAHFVEDTAVVLPELGIMTHPGALSRRGEVGSIVPELQRYKPLVHLSHKGHMDGGDVLVVGKRIFIGLTSRTDETGIQEFAALVEPYGYQVVSVEVSAGLHLKSIVNYVGNNTLLLNEQAANSVVFAGFKTIVVDKAEEYAGNTLWINNTLLTPAGYTHTYHQLNKLGLPIITLDTSEFKKMDGGLTCLSLRF